MFFLLNIFPLNVFPSLYTSLSNLNIFLSQYFFFSIFSFFSLSNVFPSQCLPLLISPLFNIFISQYPLFSMSSSFLSISFPLNVLPTQYLFLFFQCSPILMCNPFNVVFYQFLNFFPIPLSILPS